MTITISGYAAGESWEFQDVPYDVAEAVATILQKCELVRTIWDYEDEENGCE